MFAQGGQGEYDPELYRFRNRKTTYFGGSLGERVQGVSVLPNGKYLIAGETDSNFGTDPDFPVANGAEDHSYGGGSTDGFVAILNPTLGTIESWAFIGGSDQDRAYYAEAVNTNNIYVVGFTESSAGTFGATQTYGPGGDFDVFVAHLNGGLEFQDAVIIGGTGKDNPRASMTLDGNFLYVSGRTQHGSFPVVALTGNGVTAQQSFGGVEDAFLFKMDQTDLSGEWATFFGGSQQDNANANVRVAANGDVFIAGCTKSNDLPASPATQYDSSLGGAADGFVAKFAANGSLLNWTYLGGSKTDWVAFNDVLELDANGRAVVCGITRSADFPGVTAVSPYDQHSHGGTPPVDTDPQYNDLFVARLAPDLGAGAVDFAAYLGGTGREEPAGLAVDDVWNVYLVGETFSADFPTTANAYDRDYTTLAGNHDGIIARFDSVAGNLTYGSYFGGNTESAGAGGSSEDGTRGRSLVLLSSGLLLFSGQTTTNDIHTQPSVVFPSYQDGMRDGFLTLHNVQ